MNDSIETIKKSAAHFFSGTFLSRITGMLRDVSTAFVFGTDPSIAAFMVAFRLSHLLRRILGEGALQSAFIPEFESLRHQDPDRAFSFFRDLLISLSCLLGLIIVLSSAGIGLLLYTFEFSQGTSQILFLTALMLPSLLFICLYGIHSSLLQCEKIYFTPSIAPVAFNLIWISCVIFLKNTPSEKAVIYLSYGVILACFFQWVVTIPDTWNIMKKGLNTPFWKHLNFCSAQLIKLTKALSLGVLGVSATQINTAVDSIFARYISLEGPAYLWYAIRIEQLPLALFGIAVAGAILPPLSRAIKAGKLDEYQKFYNYAIEKTWLLMLPITALLILAGDLYVSILYERGDFNQNSVLGTSECLFAYAIGLIPSAFILVIAPASYANNNFKLPALASCLALVLNMILNFLFVGLTSIGAAGVALATSLTAWANFAFIASQTPPYKFTFTQHEVPLLLSTLTAFCICFFIRTFLAEFEFFQIMSFLKTICLAALTTLSFGSLLLFFYKTVFSNKFLNQMEKVE